MSAGPVVISVENVSKSYQISHLAASNETFREMLGRKTRGAARSLTGRGRSETRDDIEEFWALKDVSFEVRQGEVMGVIGRNGAGKSTLLKVLSRITAPTNGRVTLHGRVASLLEVGTGFHPELTGRENIYLNGAILGMSRQEINQRFDEIVDFAEIERFLDTPVKRYSSGMYVRLAFAVASHMEPEILIIDEVLAVGDMVFQKKCLGKMQDVAGAGRTVLFVSHNMQTVAGLTERCLLLEGGRTVTVGATNEVIQRYLAGNSEAEHEYRKEPTGTHPEFTSVTLVTSEPGGVQRHGAAMSVEIEIFTPQPISQAAVSFQVCTMMHQPVLHVLHLDSEAPMLREPGRHRLVCTFPAVRLYPGHYYFNFHFGAVDPNRAFEAPKEICQFEVAVLDEVRDLYWYPEHALYVDDTLWSFPRSMP